MKKLAISVAAVLMSGAVMAQEPYIGKDLQFMVDGKPFFVKGMVYAPEPRGMARNPGPKIPPDDANYIGNRLNKNSKSPTGWYYYVGAWICKPTNQYSTQPLDWQSSCWDDDLVGTLNIKPSTKANEDYNKVVIKKWQTDLDNMQKLGINTIRLYNINPTGKDHTTFIQMAHDRGIHIIYPVLTDYLAHQYANGQPDREAQVKGMVKNIVNETCPHGKLLPGILAYMAGNEMVPLKDEWDKRIINDSIDVVKNECPKALVSYAHNDFPNEWTLQKDANGNLTSALMEALPKMDFMTINSYRNASDDGGILGYSNLFYTDIKPVTQKYNKPILIGELGEWQNQTFKPYWYNRTWKYILENSLPAGMLGAVYFEYNDEPIKKQDNPNDQYMGITTSAWPNATDKDSYVDVPNIPKTKDYQGIPKFKDTNGTVVDFGDASKKGAGRYDMFDNDGSGIGACNYQHGGTPQKVSPACLNAK